MARLAIRMPKMSMTMTEGDVSSWMVKVGDEIAEGDVVAEVMTDKVDMEVESTVTGTLVEIVHETGTVEVGEPIAWVEGEDGGGGFGDLLMEPEPEPAPEPVVERAPDPEPAPPAPPEPDPTPVPAGPPAAVPRARGLANERGIDLGRVTGTGADGLIRVEDVEALVQPTPQAAPPAAPQTPAAAAPVSSDRKVAIRAAVARKMTPSAAIPQFTVWREVQLDAANASRRGLSWTTVLLRAYAAALRDVPDLLCRWEDDRATESGPPAVALAVATDRGLLVPTFDEPDLADPHALDAEMRDVVRAAHTGKLGKQYLGVANGSLSNLGGLGVDRFQALLTPPQASVLSLGTIQQRPVAVPGGVGLALTVHAGLTVDHRVADGAHAAQLLKSFATRLGGAL
jgi:pyruvate dehydrogenase E2 component (dihydrolipoamide acetyltransferase)